MAATATCFTGDGLERRLLVWPRWSLVLFKQSCGCNTISAPMTHNMARNRSTLDTVFEPGVSNRDSWIGTIQYYSWQYSGLSTRGLRVEWTWSFKTCKNLYCVGKYLYFYFKFCWQMTINMRWCVSGLFLSVVGLSPNQNWYQHCPLVGTSQVCMSSGWDREWRRWLIVCERYFPVSCVTSPRWIRLMCHINMCCFAVSSGRPA